MSPSTQEPTEPAENTTVRTFDCQKSGDGMFPSPYDCKEFFVCDHGYDHLFNCSAGLYYDPKVKQCNWLQLVDCKVNATGELMATTLEKTELAETTPTGMFDCEKSGDGMFPSPYDCKEFYVCYQSYDYLFNCSAGLYYDARLKTCNWPWAVDCNVNGTGELRATKLEQIEIDEITTTGGFDCKQHGDGMFPSPNDCHEFYVCDHGYVNLFKCPANLYYDPKIFECNYPENVECDLQ